MTVCSVLKNEDKIKVCRKIATGFRALKLPYFLAHKTHQFVRRTMVFSLEIKKNNNNNNNNNIFECILILVIYWKKTGLLHTKISNHNIIYSSYKPRKSSSLPLKSSSWLFSLSHDKDV